MIKIPFVQIRAVLLQVHVRNAFERDSWRRSLPYFVNASQIQSCRTIFCIDAIHHLRQPVELFPSIHLVKERHVPHVFWNQVQQRHAHHHGPALRTFSPRFLKDVHQCHGVLAGREAQTGFPHRAVIVQPITAGIIPFGFFALRKQNEDGHRAGPKFGLAQPHCGFVQKLLAYSTACSCVRKSGGRTCWWLMLLWCDSRSSKSTPRNFSQKRVPNTPPQS